MFLLLLVLARLLDETCAVVTGGLNVVHLGGRLMSSSHSGIFSRSESKHPKISRNLHVFIRSKKLHDAAPAIALGAVVTFCSLNIVLESLWLFWFDFTRRESASFSWTRLWIPFCLNRFRYLSALISQSFLDIGSVSRILDSIIKLCLQLCRVIEQQEGTPSASELEQITEVSLYDLVHSFKVHLAVRYCVQQTLKLRSVQFHPVIVVFKRTCSFCQSVIAQGQCRPICLIVHTPT